MDVIAQLEERAKRTNEAIMSYLEEGENQKLLLAVQHYPSAGGKRLRPVLAEVVAQAVGGAGEKAVPFGAAIELIHNFTLVHDDVMDNDSMRRGRPASMCCSMSLPPSSPATLCSRAPSRCCPRLTSRRMPPAGC